MPQTTNFFIVHSPIILSPLLMTILCRIHKYELPSNTRLPRLIFPLPTSHNPNGPQSIILKPGFVSSAFISPENSLKKKKKNNTKNFLLCKLLFIPFLSPNSSSLYISILNIRCSKYILELKNLVLEETVYGSKSTYKQSSKNW